MFGFWKVSNATLKLKIHRFGVYAERNVQCDQAHIHNRCCYFQMRLTTGYTRTSGKSAKLFTRKLLSGCMKVTPLIITSTCWAHRIESSFLCLLHDRSFLQLCWFPGCSASKNKKKLRFCSVVDGVWNLQDLIWQGIQIEMKLESVLTMLRTYWLCPLVVVWPLVHSFVIGICQCRRLLGIESHYVTCTPPILPLTSQQGCNAC